MKNKILFFFAAFSTIYSVVNGQDTPTKKGGNINDYYIDFAIPDITAFSLLDINTNKINRPGNVKQFAIGVQNYVDANGNLKPGLAMEFAPYKFFANGDTNNWGKNKSLKNLQISLA